MVHATIDTMVVFCRTSRIGFAFSQVMLS
uniref:Uncharacterized protein n=1 Tax=Anguilla anguilla TaxID=7936 RepID=A0A0E9U7U7_ANGAN